MVVPEDAFTIKTTSRFSALEDKTATFCSKQSCALDCSCCGWTQVSKKNEKGQVRAAGVRAGVPSYGEGRASVDVARSVSWKCAPTVGNGDAIQATALGQSSTGKYGSIQPAANGGFTGAFGAISPTTGGVPTSPVTSSTLFGYSSTTFPLLGSSILEATKAAIHPPESMDQKLKPSRRHKSPTLDSVHRTAVSISPQSNWRPVLERATMPADGSAFGAISLATPVNSSSLATDQKPVNTVGGIQVSEEIMRTPWYGESEGTHTKRTVFQTAPNEALVSFENGTVFAHCPRWNSILETATTPASGSAYRAISPATPAHSSNLA